MYEYYEYRIGPTCIILIMRVASRIEDIFSIADYLEPIVIINFANNSLANQQKSYQKILLSYVYTYVLAASRICMFLQIQVYTCP